MHIQQTFNKAVGSVNAINEHAAIQVYKS